MTVFFAYVEPGSGALLWQMLIGGIGVALFYSRRLFLPFLKVFKRKKKKSEPGV